MKNGGNLRMYFDGEESSSHKKAKEKLFDLIVQKRLKLFDQHGKEYIIFNGDHKNEFLHIESFIMDYSNEVIFSNEKSPCIKHFEEHKRKHPHCSKEGYYGAFKELPCEKCVYHNFNKYMKGSSKFASYRPDVSFGYEGVHKVWLEIKNESPCSKNKIDFCKKNNISLLEISDIDVLRFKDFNGKLIFNRIEEYVHVANIYEDIETVVKYVKEEISQNKYITLQEANNKLLKLPSSDGFIQPRNVFLLKKRIESEFSTVVTDNKSLKNYFNVNKKSNLIINNEDFDKLKELNYINDETMPDDIKIVEPSNSERVVRCFKCKGKDQVRNFIKVEAVSKKKKVHKYFHDGCLKNN